MLLVLVQCEQAIQKLENNWFLSWELVWEAKLALGISLRVADGGEHCIYGK